MGSRSRLLVRVERGKTRRRPYRDIRSLRGASLISTTAEPSKNWRKPDGGFVVAARRSQSLLSALPLSHHHQFTTANFTSRKSSVDLQAFPHIYVRLFKRASVHFVLSISQFLARPRIRPESWFASKYSLRESVVHCWRRPPKLRPRLVTRRTEALLCEDRLRDSLPLQATSFALLGTREGSCKTLFRSCSEGSRR